jgi:predicted nucleic acid-binding protein
MILPTFLDTSYILALVNTRDRFHKRARTTSRLVATRFVTTEAVLIGSEIHSHKKGGDRWGQKRWIGCAIPQI